ncbi:MAG: recombinase family protein [Candidatus Hatepunaea meridiana]|nr:recombinase family protein [Candidatus Hatepunaea meridiana]
MKQSSQRSRESSSGSSSIIRCAIYTRKSTEEGLDQDFNSLDAQRESAEAFINSQKNEGWVCLPERYDDGGFTGGNMERPAMKRLMADIEAGKIDCIVVYKVDRLSRSLMDFARIIGILEKHVISFVSVTQQFNTTHSIGRLTLNILLSFAQFEREIISERTRDKMTAARKKGKWIGGTPMLGYDIHPKGGRLIINQEEAFRVRAIYELYLDHQSLRATVRELNRRGWTTKRWITKSGRVRGGDPFQKNSLTRLLTNVIYLGKVKFKGVLYEGEHQAILEADKLQLVTEIRMRNKRDGGKLVRNKYGALLKGLLYCIPCQAPMVQTFAVKKKNTCYRYYVCSRAQRQGWHTCPTKSVPVVDIERFVIDRIRSIGRDSDLITETLNQARSQVRDGTEKLESELLIVTEELKRHTKEVDRLLNDTAQRFEDHTRKSTRLTDLEDQIRFARQHAESLQEEIAKKKTELVDETALTSALEGFDPIWESLLPRERTRVIHLLIEKVGYDGENGMLSITFRPTGIKTLVENSDMACEETLGGDS